MLHLRIKALLPFPWFTGLKEQNVLSDTKSQRKLEQEQLKTSHTCWH